MINSCNITGQLIFCGTKNANMAKMNESLEHKKHLFCLKN